ncbi:methyltransferase-like protein 13 isoform X2 [Phalaenopsis equestris]|uniref:methyltransferase-like protein 13 isoform X2 n=1 Tax=Phalaenopsis equestris TaxID=78828 RepID=UPI0009E3E5DA|nr:methyltransferase-like protein 13 isoform X2 [Phalaenopsis equestris]
MSSSTGLHSYGEPAYWDQRYREDPSPFDWYQKYKALAPLFHLYIRPSHHILLVGCGNSRNQDADGILATIAINGCIELTHLLSLSSLGEDLVSDGYLDVVNIDISSVVVEAMQKKFEGKAELKYIKMDVRDMSVFESGSFDAVIDKGTLDSLMCGQNAHLNAIKMLEEVGRILKNNGVYILITYGEPSYRLHLLKELQFWTINLHIIDRVEKNPEQRTWELTKPLPLIKDGTSITALIGSNVEVHYIYDETLRRQADSNARTEEISL